MLWITEVFRKLAVRVHPDKSGLAGDSLKALKEAMGSLAAEGGHTIPWPAPCGLGGGRDWGEPIPQWEVEELGRQFWERVNSQR